jgi:Zn-dependent M28 family amino/carboxypeptidase
MRGSSSVAAASRRSARARSFAYLVVTALVALCPAVAGASLIDDIVNQVSLSEYQSYLRVLTGVDAVPGSPGTYITDRYSYGSNIDVAAAYISGQFSSWGLDTTLDTFNASYGPNVIGELAGTTRPDDIYIICGHYDTYNASNQYDAPGCDDNASGTAAAMMAAHIFSNYQFEGTVRFIAFAGEEQWMVGSQAYAQAASLAGENIVAVINYDMFLQPGFDNADPDPDYDLDIGGDAQSEWLANLVAAQIAAYGSIDTEVHVDSNFVSDQWSFWPYGYSAVGCIENTPNEIWGGSNDVYHSSADVITNPDYDWPFALDAIRGGYAALASLATPIPEPSTLALIALGLALLLARRRR